MNVLLILLTAIGIHIHSEPTVVFTDATKCSMETYEMQQPPGEGLLYGDAEAREVTAIRDYYSIDPDSASDPYTVTIKRIRNGNPIQSWFYVVDNAYRHDTVHTDLEYVELKTTGDFSYPPHGWGYCPSGEACDSFYCEIKEGNILEH